MKVDKATWEKLTLGDVCTFRRGLTYPKSEESQQESSNIVLRSNNIDLSSHSLLLTDFKYLNSKYSIPDEKKVLKDSILMCMSNGSSAHIGKVAFIDKHYDLAFGGFMGLIIPQNVVPKFLYYKYRSESFKNFLLKIGNGINITNLKFSSIAPIPISLPSLSEQRGIAAELDAVQAIIDGYREQLADLDRLAQSIFLDTFGDPISNPKGWEIKRFGEVCAKITDGTHLSPKFQESGIPFIFVSNIVGNILTYNAQKYISEETYNELWKSTPIEVGDILYSSVGSYGHPAIVASDRKFMFQRHIALLKPDRDIIDSVFFHTFLSTPQAFEQATSVAIGAAKKH